MKWYYKIGLGLMIVILAYLIGNLIPIKYLSPTVDSTPIKTAEYYGIIISSLSAFVTFLAVIIALFKEDIRKIWEYSKIQVSIPKENFFEILNSSIGHTTDNSNQPLEAIKYNCKIEIYNSGSISAMGLEMQLESLVYTGSDYPTPQIIETLGQSINWNGLNETKINLPPEGKKALSILELSAPEQQSSPTGQNVLIPAKLVIANIDNNSDFKKGKWTAAFAIFSTNAKPVRFKIEIDWNGRWQMRATEMKNNLKIDLKN